MVGVKEPAWRVGMPIVMERRRAFRTGANPHMRVSPGLDEGDGRRMPEV